MNTPPPPPKKQNEKFITEKYLRLKNMFANTGFNKIKARMIIKLQIVKLIT